MADALSRARAFLSGEKLTVKEADGLWKELKSTNQISRARAVLARMRESDSLMNPEGLTWEVRCKTVQQEAELTSKDPELSSATRHDAALAILRREFDFATLIRPTLRI